MEDGWRFDLQMIVICSVSELEWTSVEFRRLRVSTWDTVGPPKQKIVEKWGKFTPIHPQYEKYSHQSFY